MFEIIQDPRRRRRSCESFQANDGTEKTQSAFLPPLPLLPALYVYPKVEDARESFEVSILQEQLFLSKRIIAVLPVPSIFHKHSKDPTQ